MTPYCSAGYILYIKEWYNSKQGAKYSSISLVTMQLPCLTDLRSLWYVNGLKIVPSMKYKLGV